MTFIRLDISPESEAVMRKHERGPGEMITRLSDTLGREMDLTAGFLKSTMLRGGLPGVKRDGRLPLAVRSGRMLGSISSGLDAPLSGYIGSAGLRYAKVILGKDPWTMKAKKAKHLWIPIADNLDPSGVPRMTPSAAMSLVDNNGRRMLRFFKSKAGNLVAFLPEGKLLADQETDRDIFAPSGERHKRNKSTGFFKGKLKGQLKGKLLFVLKDEVTVQGTDALAAAVDARHDEISRALTEAANQAIAPGS